MIVPQILQIDNSQAHLWYIYPENISDKEKLQSLLEILSEEEKIRQRAFYFEKDRHLYLTAHAFVRFCLSKYADVKPEEWVFQRNEYGKPCVDYSINGLPLKFNLSHTEGLISCLITLQHEVGVDVEPVRINKDRMDIAERFFSSEEFRELQMQNPEDRHKRFCQYWTLKEAYIKAKGVGLSMPLDKFFFRFDNENNIKIYFHNKESDCNDDWQFSLYDLKDKYMCASAISSNGFHVAVTLAEEEL